MYISSSRLLINFLKDLSVKDLDHFSFNLLLRAFGSFSRRQAKNDTRQQTRYSSQQEHHSVKSSRGWERKVTEKNLYNK